ncbi:MAG TPA: amidohydrolase family protein [Gemmatimonadaceae bacterium]|jgi:imidazolonepropionase-like amidohydrolase|nr:amidohydrolase family protein [Gemmatimonadaceae bacterium]
MRATLKVLATVVSLAATASVADAQAAPGQDTTYLIRGGTVVNPGAAPMPNTDILIRNNRIVSVGPGASSANAKVIDATGKFIYPGMIDANTGIGLSEIGGIATMGLRSEMGQFNPHMKALVALNVESELLGVTRMNGVTTVLTSPTGGVISGQATLINTAGWTWEDLAVVRTAGMMINLPGSGGGGGRGGGGGGGRGGGAPAGNVAQLTADFEQFMTESRDYNAGRDAGTTKLDLIYEAMRPVFKREVPAIIPAGNEQSIRNAVAFGEKWNIRVVISGGGEAWKVRKFLAEKNIPVILGSLESAPGDNLPYDAIYAQPGLLYDAGVKFAFSTGSGSNARHVAFHAALAVAYGLPLEGALKALTIWPAEILGADKQIGSIAQGKLANLFITTGDPLDLRTQVAEVFIKGRQVPDDDRQHRLYLKYKARPLPVIVP